MPSAGQFGLPLTTQTLLELTTYTEPVKARILELLTILVWNGRIPPVS